MIFSRPTNAPANTKRMFVVSMVYCSLLPIWPCTASRPPLSRRPPSLPPSLLLLRSLFAWTVTVVPSIILRRPCCTPSPETSRPCVMMAGFASLSTSSKKMMPVSHFWMECWAARRRRSMLDSMSVPMYPAWVRAEQSTVAKGTSRTRARVLRMYVFPTPEGPRSRTLDFSITVRVSSGRGKWPSSGSGGGAADR